MMRYYGCWDIWKFLLLICILMAFDKYFCVDNKTFVMRNFWLRRFLMIGKFIDFGSCSSAVVVGILCM